MTEIETGLRDLAADVAVPPLDLRALHRTADRQALRQRLLGAALAVALLGGAGGVAVALHDPRAADRLDTAAPPPTVGRAAAPSAERLRQVLRDAFPGLPAPAVDVLPAGPLGPGSSVFGAPGRTLTADGVFTSPTSSVRALWYAVDLPLADEEADARARGVYPPDPDPLPAPEATRFDLGYDAGEVRTAVYAWDGRVTALSWSSAGGIVQVQVQGTDAALARGAGDATRALLDPRSPAAVAPTTPAPEPLPAFVLRRVPAGYPAASRLSASSDQVEQVVQYVPDDPARNGERLTVVSTRLPPAAYLARNRLSEPVAETTVRGGRPATEHVVGTVGDPHARHCLLWEERPGLLVAVYAFDDLPALEELADGLQER